MSEGALPYHEPDITTILTQASFLLLLNIVAVILDGVVYCGLVGQVLSGMAWGTPGAKLLPQSCEEVVTQLGYLGLIALVFEGGLSTSIKSIKNNLALAILVAVTGISGPIALSFALLRLASATNVQAFAAGAALCSTSLGTTFSLLKSTGLTQSRLGIVLITAAMLDDVVGLILVQIITNLGSGQTSIEASTILRPIFVSIGLVLGLVVSCRYIFRPMVSHARATKVLCHLGPLNPMLLGGSLHFIISTLFLLALVTAASYAGTSVLFAAYLAGASVSWLDGRIGPETGSTRAVQPPREHVEIEDSCKVSERATDIQLPTLNDENANGLPTDESDEAVLRCDRQMKQPIPPPDTLLSNNKPVNNCSSYHMSESVTLQSRSMLMYEKFYAPAVERILKPFFFASIGFTIPITRMFQGKTLWRGMVYTMLMIVGKLVCGLWLIRISQPSPRTQGTESKPQKKSIFSAMPRPKSLYPATILGCAMVARGEIGFLISAVANANGVFRLETRPSAEVDVFLVISWAILLCTIIGPVALGCIVKRVKRLQAKRGSNHGKEDPLGVWGIVEVEGSDRGGRSLATRT